MAEEMPTNVATATLPRHVRERPGNPTTVVRASQEPSSAISAVRIVDDRYELEAEIGGGGMGVVYRARDLKMASKHDPDPYVALKMLSAKFGEIPGAAASLQRECARAQRLSHENILRVFHYGEDEETRSEYMTMELLHGQALDSILNESERCLSWTVAEPWIRQMLAGLKYAHRQGLVHSDIKPGNLFITTDQTLKILDFGIAVPLRQTAVDRADTMFNPRRLGVASVLYASLEMQLGANADIRDDVYSAACVIYEMLSGRPPYSHEAILRGPELCTPPARIPHISPAQNAALQNALALSRKLRTPSIAEFERAFFDGKRRRFVTRHIWLAATTVVIAAAGAIGWIYRPAVPSGVGAAPEVEPHARAAEIAHPSEPPPPFLADRAALLLRLLGVDAPGGRSNLTAEIVGSLLRSAPRAVHLGSTPEQISAALALCKRFTSGCARSWFSDERLRTVRLRPFAMDATLVSVAEFGHFVDSSGFRTQAETTGVAYDAKGAELRQLPGGTWQKTGDAQSADSQSPVRALSYRDALAYCNAVQKRLPSEDEWEYVAMGPERRLYPWGDDPGGAPPQSAIPRVTDGPSQGIGSAYRGLSGAVWQWTDEGPATAERALKGGEWRDANPVFKRAAAHVVSPINVPAITFGVRCASDANTWPDAQYWLAALASEQG